MTKLKRWLPLLALTTLVLVRGTLTFSVEEDEGDDHAKLVGSSIVASVSVVRQEKNGSSSPDSRKVVPVYEPLASPADLLRPDRFQFYTFNNNGEVVTKQMTEKEIQSLIAAGGGHYPMEIHEPMKTDNMLGGETKVADVVQNVQNVLKGELNKPTTMMVPVPTVPGHATDEWSNILPSILPGDSEATLPANGMSQFDDDKSTIYKPQPAIILEMEPHVHEPPSQILMGPDFLDHHVRPLDMKPHLVNPDSEEKDTPLDQVPLQTWNTPTKGQDFHYITTEIIPMQKNHSEKVKSSTPKPITMINHRNKNSTFEQSINKYSEIPMIPVSVITADQILTSTQRNKINERPVFQMLSTISPSAASTVKTSDVFDHKFDDISIISETHTTSVKYPGYPEMKVSEKGGQTTVPVRVKPTMDENKTTASTTFVPITEENTDSIFSTTYSILSEKSSTMIDKVTQGTTNVKDGITLVTTMMDSLPSVTTEMNQDMIADTTIMNDVTTTKSIIEEDMNQTKEQSTMTDAVMTTGITEQMLERTTLSAVTKDELSTEYERMTTTLPPLTNDDLADNDEVLSSDLANSLSSVISQVAETIPSLLADTPNFPLSELKSKNISMSNDMFDSTTTRPLLEEFSTLTEGLNVETTSSPIFEETTFEPSTYITEITSDRFDSTMLPTDQPDKIYERLSETTSKIDLTTTIFEDKFDSTTIPTIASSDFSTSLPVSNNTDSMFMTKTNEKNTEATIIHLEVTGAPANASVPYTTENSNNTSESPLIRIQLADIVSNVNHVIDNAPLKSEMSSTVHNMTLPPNPYAATPNIASGLIAGYLLSTTQHSTEINKSSNITTDKAPMKDDENTEKNYTQVDLSKLEPITESESSSVTVTSSWDGQTEMSTLQTTIPTIEISAETNAYEDKSESSTNINNNLSETTASLIYETSYQTESSTAEFMTTTEPVTIFNFLNKTNKPEAPIVRIDISPESTPSNLPPRIQLTDLPILQESTTSSNSLSTEKEIANISNSHENPSLLHTNTYSSTDNVGTEQPTTVLFSPSTNNETMIMYVPCNSDMKNSSRCQNYSNENTGSNAQVNENYTYENLMEKNVTNIETSMSKENVTTTNIETSTNSENDTNNNTFVNKTNESLLEVKIQEPLHNLQLSNTPINYVQKPLKNESSTSYELLKPLSTDTADSETTTIMFNTKPMKNETLLSTMKYPNKEDMKATTSAPMKSTPSKQDSYIKLGEQLTKEEMNNTNANFMKPQKPFFKRPTTTIKPGTNKPFSNAYTTSSKFSSKPTKTPLTTGPPTFFLIDEKRPEPVTEVNKMNEEHKWTLIPQQSTSPFATKIKQEVSESPMQSSTMFPSGDLHDYSHRTGSKPVNLDVVKNSAGLDDSVRYLDEDIKYFSNLCNELAFSFWSSANKGLSNSRSLALSPFGMTSMLAMIFLGARGPTSAQMNDILKLDDVATFNPHLVFQNITDAVSLARNQGIANAAFVRLLFADRIKVGKLMPFYKEQAQKFYEGYVAEVNFSTISDQVKRRTNLLVRKQTGGRIKDFVKTNTVPLRSPLAALSANVFQTNCNSTGASSDGRDGEMYFAVPPAVRQRRLVPVPATVWRSGVLAGYEPGLDATAIALGGSEKLVSTIFVIPGQQGFTAPGDTLDRLEQRLMRSAYRDKAWDKLLKVIVPRPALELQVPKFSHRSVVNATAALKRMGLEELFTRHANLKGINGFGHDIHLADVLQMNLFSTCGEENISSGRHHVEIYPGTPMRNSREIDLELQEDFKSTKTVEDDGTANSYEMLDDYMKDPRLIKSWSREAEVSEKPRLRLDRPFLYFVRHNPTGLILHMGRFNPRLLQ